MKILAINCKPNFDYFTSKGLNIEVEYKTISEIFPLRFLYNMKNEAGVTVPLFSPWVEEYLEQNYKDFKYSAILVGWNPKDYSNDLKNTGGYTHHTALKSGIRWATIRQDIVPNNNHILHEMMHTLCNIINIDFKDYKPKDYMDVSKQGYPYFKNESPNAPDGNYAQTWEGIKPFLPQLNAIKYSEKPIVTLTRLYDWGNQTVGRLDFGSFTCNTLERGWKNNQSNISSIPTGTYNGKWTFSPKFMRYTYEIQNVHARSGIRMHPASFWSNLLGCISLGSGWSDLNRDKLPDLLNSKKTVEQFELLMNKKDFTLIVK